MIIEQHQQSPRELLHQNNYQQHFANNYQQHFADSSTSVFFGMDSRGGSVFFSSSSSSSSSTNTNDKWPRKNSNSSYCYSDSG